ncbi:hypothetical protein BpHYR1_054235 [Brachionus plicatilis]|uniref:Uncharacterized protein n=1 Tax=Brachionus plicatilis TaxID=10195 RepID=A0A3M7SRC9_BRAPC|nr:hypothetical protein BpHYR1_054235 [Brachionus plicatilis]
MPYSSVPNSHTNWLYIRSDSMYSSHGPTGLFSSAQSLAHHPHTLAHSPHSNRRWVRPSPLQTCSHACPQCSDLNFVWTTPAELCALWHRLVASGWSTCWSESRPAWFAFAPSFWLNATICSCSEADASVETVVESAADQLVLVGRLEGQSHGLWLVTVAARVAWMALAGTPVDLGLAMVAVKACGTLAPVGVSAPDADAFV